MPVPCAAESPRGVYSYGGREDHLLDASKDRVTDACPEEPPRLRTAGTLQESRDLLDVLGPAPSASRPTTSRIPLAYERAHLRPVAG
ncbi:hypothetical protein ACFZDD_43680 [Streptomyces griseorubiginosus]|uniref:GP88 family protein n=1 Tax=Streptomyces griseorubiginosus TaxID=67304 RepID=UPI0036EAE7AB